MSGFTDRRWREGPTLDETELVSEDLLVEEFYEGDDE